MFLELFPSKLDFPPQHETPMVRVYQKLPQDCKRRNPIRIRIWAKRKTELFSGFVSHKSQPRHVRCEFDNVCPRVHCGRHWMANSPFFICNVYLYTCISGLYVVVCYQVPQSSSLLNHRRHRHGHLPGCGLCYKYSGVRKYFDVM